MSPEQQALGLEGFTRNQLSCAVEQNKSRGESGMQKEEYVRFKF